MFRTAAKRASGKRVVGTGYVKKKSGRSNAVALTTLVLFYVFSAWLERLPKSNVCFELQFFKTVRLFIKQLRL